MSTRRVYYKALITLAHGDREAHFFFSRVMSYALHIISHRYFSAREGFFLSTTSFISMRVVLCMRRQWRQRAEKSGRTT